MSRLLQGFLARLPVLPRKTLFPILALALTVVTGTALVAFAPEPDRKAVETLAIPVTTLEAEVRALSPEVHLYGRVETPHMARLTALITAPVESLLVREGDRVAKGAVLVQLDETDARLLVRRRAAESVEARAALDGLQLAGADDRAVLEHQQELHRLATDKLERYRRLREQRSINEEIWKAVLEERHAQAIALSRQRRLVLDFAHRLASAEARVDRVLASLEEARVQLERTRVRAPFQGRVTRVAVAPGERVAPGTAVAEIYDDTTLQIRVQIPNVHLPVLQRALALGERPRAMADFGDRRATGALDRLVGAVGAGQSGVDGLVRLDLDGLPPDLGRTVSLRITLPAQDNVVAVPVQAVYGQQRLFLIEDGRLTGIDVERVGAITGNDGEQRLLVRSDAFDEGTRILTSQLTNAVTGLRVRVEDVAPTDTDGA